jgi:cyclase
MLRPRVIPCLLVSDGGLVKTRRFRSPQYVGDPNNAIRIFNEKEADELIVIDIGASRHGRGPDLQLIAEFAGECYMPVTYGGGVTSVEDAARILALGVEKVCVQSAVAASPRLVSDLAARFGSQAVVVSVDVRRGAWGREQARFSAPGARPIRDWQAWMSSLVDAGAGEVLLTSVDREGTMEGMDIDLITRASSAIDVPLIANGGVSSLDDISAAFAAGASAVAAGAYFVFYGPHRAVLISYPDESAFESLAVRR